jgi:hypothetical protein
MRREEKTEIMEDLKEGFYRVLHSNFQTQFSSQCRPIFRVSRFMSMLNRFCKIYRQLQVPKEKITHSSIQLVLML